MGYTHYYELSPEACSPMQAMLLCQDARQIIETSGVPIVGWNSRDLDSQPELNPEGRIALNGCGEDGCETFMINFHAPLEPDGDNELGQFDYDQFIRRGRRVWSFCKTRQRPYDDVVTAILLRACDLIPGFDVSSDGSWTGDWLAGRTLYSNVFGIESVCPWQYD